MKPDRAVFPVWKTFMSIVFTLAFDDACTYQEQLSANSCIT